MLMRRSNFDGATAAFCLIAGIAFAICGWLAYKTIYAQWLDAHHLQVLQQAYECAALKPDVGLKAHVSASGLLDLRDIGCSRGSILVSWTELAAFRSGALEFKPTAQMGPPMEQMIKGAIAMLLIIGATGGVLVSSLAFNWLIDRPRLSR